MPHTGALVEHPNLQPAVTWEKPPALAVQLDTSHEGLHWEIMAINTTLLPIEGEVQVEWRVPATAREKVLTLAANDVPEVSRAFVVDSVVMNRPEAYIRLWMGERFFVSLEPGAFVVLTGTLVGSPDVDQDGLVDSGDVASVLAAWNQDCCQADVNCDGIVQIEDLTLVLGALGG